MPWQDTVVDKTVAEPIFLWEIMVPTEKRVKPPAPDPVQEPDDFARWQRRTAYTTRYHRIWDERVRAITGGLTIMTPAKGQWVSPDGTLYSERMIPVRIAATRPQIEKVIDMTLDYYDQLAIMCYRISDTVIIRHREDK